MEHIDAHTPLPWGQLYWNTVGVSARWAGDGGQGRGRLEQESSGKTRHDSHVCVTCWSNICCVCVRLSSKEKKIQLGAILKCCYLWQYWSDIQLTRSSTTYRNNYWMDWHDIFVHGPTEDKSTDCSFSDLALSAIIIQWSFSSEVRVGGLWICSGIWNMDPFLLPSSLVLSPLSAPHNTVGAAAEPETLSFLLYIFFLLVKT